MLLTLLQLFTPPLSSQPGEITGNTVVENETISTNAVRAVGTAWPALIDALKDTDAQVRFAAHGALALLRVAAVQAVTDALKDSDPQVRSIVASELGQIGEQAKAAVPALIDVLKDQELSVRRTAASALVRIGEVEAAIPTLIDTLKDPDALTRGCTAIELGNFGAEAKAAVPALIAARKDRKIEYRNMQGTEKTVSYLAREALSRIDPEAAKKAGVS